jgi:hypothetical protein
LRCLCVVRFCAGLAPKCNCYYRGVPLFPCPLFFAALVTLFVFRECRFQLNGYVGMGCTQSSGSYEAPTTRYTISQIKTALAELNLGRFGAAFATAQDTAPTLGLRGASKLLRLAGAAPGEVAAITARLSFSVGGKPSKRWHKAFAGTRVVVRESSGCPWWVPSWCRFQCPLRRYPLRLLVQHLYSTNHQKLTMGLTRRPRNGSET